MPPTEEFHVLIHFLEQWDWAIDAYRSYLNANFPRSTTLTLCAITFLTMTEVMRLRYARHPPLQAGADGEVGYSVFKLLSVIPIFGVSAIRVIEIFTLSRSIALTVCIAVISVMPAEVPPAAMSLFRRVRSWVTRSERDGVSGVDPALLRDQTGLREGHFESTQARHLSIIDTMQAVVHRNVVLVLISVGRSASAAVTAVVAFLEWIARAAHRRLRNGGGSGCEEGDISLEGMPV